MASNRPTKDAVRKPSAQAINCLREIRSASRPSGIASSKNGSVWKAARNPISPGPAFNANTATMGTAARLTCSADCAARLAQARRWNASESCGCARLGGWLIDSFSWGAPLWNGC